MGRTYTEDEFLILEDEMADYEIMDEKNVIVGRLEHGGDMENELLSVCEQNNVTCGWINALGAVKKARLGYYDQAEREYLYHEIDEPLEITMFVGNISLKEGDTMVHAHVTLADEAGNCYGGHLGEGTIVFACEFKIQILAGSMLNREFDEETGLTLWDI